MQAPRSASSPRTRDDSGTFVSRVKVGSKKSKRFQKSVAFRGVDAPRLAIASLERLLGVLARKGKKAAPPVKPQELVDRERMLRRPLPPSYRVVLERTASIGESDVLLSADAMARKKETIDDAALVPFCEGREQELICFDRKAEGESGELPIYAWKNGEARLVAKTFAVWLDGIADKLEESIASAADVPPSLRALLAQLGFTFDDPIVGRLETGDVAAIEELIGTELAREVRGKHQRLFDSSGKASLTLNLDEFSLAVSLRTGIYVMNAEDVFRWLRYFRDENFFANAGANEKAKDPAHPDRARDLKRAPREPPLVLRGVLTVSTLSSGKHTFRAASGASPKDFHVLGRTASTGRGTSLLLHVVHGNVASAHAIDEPLSDIHVEADGSIWGLVSAGSAIRFQAGTARAFPLRRVSRGRAWFYGITNAAGRVVAYGAGALLQFDGTSFVPFQPDPHVEANESIVAIATGAHSGTGSSRELAMLVSSEQVGAVARFDGRKWLAIGEDAVIDGGPIHVDVWRHVAIVLCKDGRLHRAEPGAEPRNVVWDMSLDAFRTEAGTVRALHEVRGVDGGALLASDGGVVVVGSGDPVFYSAPSGGPADRAYLSRVGGSGASKDSAIVVTCGPNVWTWENGAMSVLDLRAW